jgi:hypothetical protein
MPVTTAFGGSGIGDEVDGIVAGGELGRLGDSDKAQGGEHADAVLRELEKRAKNKQKL